MSVNFNLDITRGNPKGWVNLLWHILECYREDCIPHEEHDDEWDEICTVMAWLEEELGLQEDS